MVNRTTNATKDCMCSKIGAHVTDAERYYIRSTSHLGKKASLKTKFLCIFWKKCFFTQRTEMKCKENPPKAQHLKMLS
jgi:hypothetical protein